MPKSFEIAFEAPKDHTEGDEAKIQRARAFQREKERLKASTEAFTTQR